MAKRQLYSTIVAEDLKKHISATGMKPGDQLSTEADLCEKYSVSRTVIREAIIRLRSEGIVEARQGKGVFVSERSNECRFAVRWDLVKTHPETIELMQLRLAVEVESAGLCAAHRTAAQAAQIRRMLDKVDGEAAQHDSQAIIYDFEFHLSIARASGNRYIYDFLKFLEPVVVARFSISPQLNQRFTDQYVKVGHNEHKAIVRAIDLQDENAARKAMRQHLLKSIDRFANIAQHLHDPTGKKAPARSSSDLVLDAFMQNISVT